MSALPCPPAAVHGRPAVARGFALVRSAATLGIWAAVGVAVGLALAIAAPPLFGYQTLTVLSGSMEPAVGTGDVVVDARIRPLEAKIGDVVTFTDPENRTRLITHRVTRMERAGGNVRFQTKGDANNTVEKWQVPVSGTIGRVEYRVPKLGYVLAHVRGPFGRLLLVAVPALLLGLYELKRIWLPNEKADARA